MGGRLFLPDVDWPVPNPSTGGVAPRPALFRAASGSEPGRQQTMRFVPEGSPIRVILGEMRVSALLLNAIASGDYLYMQCLWCWDEPGNEGVQSITMNDEAVPTGVSVVHYDGGAGNVLDPWLSAAFTANGKTYADTLPGWCYTVAKVPVSIAGTGGLPQFAAVVRGVKAYDERSSLTVWTDNPSLLTARYVSDANWGMGVTVDHSTLPDCADANDETVGGDKRRRLGLAIEEDTDVADMLEALRTYAGCWVLTGQDGARFVPDRPLVSLTAIGDGTAIKIRSIDETEKRGRHEAPTLVRVWYTDRTVTPWRRHYAEAKHPLLDSGGVPYLASEVRLWGIPNYSQALREAIERLNKLRLSDLTVRYGLFDEGVQFEPGDGVTLTSGIAALAAKPLRIFSRSGGLGDWDFVVAEYDPLAYSDAVGTDPTFEDTNLASPSNPQPPGVLNLAEEQFQRSYGEADTRIVATWTAPSNFPWVGEYLVNVIDGAVVVWSGRTTADDLAFRTGAIQEGKTYQVDVYTISRNGTQSAAASDTILALGDQLPPGDVTVLTGIAANGEIHLSVGGIVDKNLAGYSVRFVSVAGDWSAATEFAFEAARSGIGAYVRSKRVPAGTWDILVKGLDTLGNYSANAKRMTLTVPAPDDSSLLDSYVFDTPSLTLLTEDRIVPWGPRHWISDAGDPLGYGHADTDDSTGVFDDLGTLPWAVPRSGGDSVWLSEDWDIGQEIAGDWRATVDYTDLSGTATITLQLSLDGVGWDDYVGGVAKASSRFARIEVRSAGVFRVEDSVRIDVVAETRDEYIETTSSSSGATVITLSGEYAKRVEITVEISATGPRNWTIGTVTLGAGITNQFEIYVFDSDTGLLSADPIRVKFRGV